MVKWYNSLLIVAIGYYILIVILFFKRNWVLVKSMYRQVLERYSSGGKNNGLGTTKGTEEDPSTKSE